MLREVDQSHSFVDDVPPYARAEKRGTSISGKELWIPQSNMDLHIEYPVPTVLELAVMWSDYMEGDTSSLTTADGVYGVFAQPVRDITGFASIDLCEVVRQTHVGLHMIERDDPDAITDYHKYTPDHAIRDDLTPAAQVLINAGLIPPVENIHAIRTIMRRWKQNGIYTF